MSIYTVKLCEFYNNPNEDRYEMSLQMVITARCHACGGNCRWKSAVARHSLAYCGGEIWCSWDCFKSKKEYKLDKRQLRTLNRRWTKLYPLMSKRFGKGFNL